MGALPTGRMGSSGTGETKAVGTGQCVPAVYPQYRRRILRRRRRQHSHLLSTCEARWHQILVSREQPSRYSARRSSDNRRDMPAANHLKGLGTNCHPSMSLSLREMTFKKWRARGEMMVRVVLLLS